MGSYLDKPVVDKSNVTGKFGDIRYAVASMQGWRCRNNDAYSVCTGLQNYPELMAAGVFDGHGNELLSKFCAKHFISNVAQMTEFEQGNIPDAIRCSLSEIDNVIPLLVDADGSGTTAISVFISPTTIYYANLGTSRVIMCRSGQVIFSTIEHEPTSLLELERIYKTGGCVISGLVNNKLAMSRAIGFFEFKASPVLGYNSRKENLIITEPDIYIWERDPSDEFIVMASDGVWAAMSNDEVCEYVHARMSVKRNLVDIANEVLDTCLSKGSRDNMTIIIIAFKNAPSYSERAHQIEQNLDEQIVRLVSDIMTHGEVTEYIDVMKLVHENRTLKGLPPGGGIYSKISLIQRVFLELDPFKECNFFPHY